MLFFVPVSLCRIIVTEGLFSSRDPGALIAGFFVKPVDTLLLVFASYQIVVKIKPLYLTHNTCYLTFNTTRVFQQ